MSVAYFDCFSGISGDMALGALVDAGADRALLEAAVEALGLGAEVRLDIRHETRGHVRGTRVLVAVDQCVERTVPELRRTVEQADLPSGVKTRSLDAIDRLAAAEAKVHGVPQELAHLHELGGADTLVDLVGAFWLIDSLDLARVYASPLPAPRGMKGDMPLPAPASLRVLEGTGAVLQPSDELRELVTPTGAAILASCATFERPAISLRRVGYGVGGHERAGNALAVWIGDEISQTGAVIVVETNLDDMAPNLIAALSEDLMQAGALDVALVPALMKKGRPGVVLTVMSPPELAGRLTELLLRSSSTLGVRLTPVQRVLAGRRVVEVSTALGTARVKVKELDGRAVDVAPEHEDCRRIARETGRDLREVMRLVDAAARQELGLA